MTTFFDLPTAFALAEEEDRSVTVQAINLIRSLGLEGRDQLYDQAQTRLSNDQKNLHDYHRVQPLRRTIAVESLITNLLATPVQEVHQEMLKKDLAWVINNWAKANQGPDIELYCHLRERRVHVCPKVHMWVAGFSHDLPGDRFGECKEVTASLAKNVCVKGF